MDPRLRTYSLLLGGVFWTPLLVWVVLQRHVVEGSRLLPALVAVAVAGEELLMRGREQGDDDSALSLSAVAHVAAAILLAPIAAALVAALGVLVSDGLRRDGRRYLLLNSAMFGGATWIAAAVYHSMAGQTPWGFALIPALCTLIALRYAVTSLVFAGGVALREGESLRRSIGRALVEEIPSAVGEGSMGVLVAFAIGRQQILLPFLLPLLGALFFARANLERLRRETQEALQAIADVVDARDPSTIEHSERVAELVRRFAAAVDLPPGESRRLVAAARFHDLGKIAIDTRALTSSERLSDEEVAQIRMHPRLSGQLLRPFSFARQIAEFASLHHERWDGTGYYGVSGERVPIEAHVLIAADSFDAMTSARPYRPALTEDEAATELLDKADTQFHPVVARAFAASVLGEPIEHRVGPGELRDLRAAFTRVRARPQLAQVGAEPRLLAMAAFVVTLAGISIGGVPPAVVFVLAALTAALVVLWLVIDVRLRMRRRRAAAAARAELPAAQLLAGAGFAGWGAPIDGDLRQPADADLPLPVLSEIQSWLKLGAPERLKLLADGSWAVRSDAPLAGLYTVIGLERRPRAYEVELAEWLADLVQASTRYRPRAHVGSTTGERAVIRIELDAFDRVRRGAGQLVAERVMDEIERRLRSVLRANDAVLRLGEDVFVISLVLGRDDLDLVERRLRSAIAEVPVPQRLDALQPHLVLARAADAHRHPELAEIEAKLLPAPALA